MHEVFPEGPLSHKMQPPSQSLERSRKRVRKIYQQHQRNNQERRTGFSPWGSRCRTLKNPHRPLPHKIVLNNNILPHQNPTTLSINTSITPATSHLLQGKNNTHDISPLTSTPFTVLLESPDFDSNSSIPVDLSTTPSLSSCTQFLNRSSRVKNTARTLVHSLSLYITRRALCLKPP